MFSDLLFKCGIEANPTFFPCSPFVWINSECQHSTVPIPFVLKQLGCKYVGATIKTAPANISISKMSWLIYSIQPFHDWDGIYLVIHSVQKPFSNEIGETQELTSINYLSPLAGLQGTGAFPIIIVQRQYTLN